MVTIIFKYRKDQRIYNTWIKVIDLLIVLVSIINVKLCFKGEGALMHFTNVFDNYYLVRFLDLDASFEPMQIFCVHIRYIWDDGGWRRVEADDEVIL